MGVGISGWGIGDHGGVADKGVHKEAAGKSRGICSRKTNI